MSQTIKPTNRGFSARHHSRGFNNLVLSIALIGTILSQLANISGQAALIVSTTLYIINKTVQIDTKLPLSLHVHELQGLSDDFAKCEDVFVIF